MVILLENCKECFFLFLFKLAKFKGSVFFKLLITSLTTSRFMEMIDIDLCKQYYIL